MSLPGELPAQVGAHAGDGTQSEPLSFTLIIVSPSTGVTSPLTFPQLAAVTTVGQLKEKIRDALPSNPSNDGQRLIHRGRLLARDDESMLQIFGQEAIGSSEPQTLHLVLRPTGPDPPPIPPSTPLVPPQRVTTPIHHQPRPQSTPANPIYGMQAQQPLPGFQPLQQHNAIHQAEHWQNVLGQRLQALQRETARLHQEMGNIEQRSRVLVSAHPDIFNTQHEHVAQPPHVPLAGMQGSHIPPSMSFRPTQSMPISFPPRPQLPPSLQQFLHPRVNERASAEGQHGIQSLASDANNAPLHRQTQSGRASPNIHRPDHTATYSREGIGPNGERWQMTVNETTSTIQMPQHPHLRHHDHHQVPGTNPAPNGLQSTTRTTSTPVGSQSAPNSQHLQDSIAGAANPPPSAATVLQPNTFSRVALPGAYLPPIPVFNPQPGTNTTAQNIAPSMNSLNPAPGSMDPTVFILSSPQGPQALLINNSETYYALAPRPRRRRTESPTSATAAQTQAQEQDAAAAPDLQARAAQRLARRVNRRRHENHPLEPVRAPHGNPGAGALGARMGPMIWLIIRLAGFVWFFTAGNNSWPRFAMITALAFVVFIINTGIFNGIAETLWGPVRRHVEGLIPLAGPEAALVPAANAAVIPPQGQQQQPEAAPPGDGPRPRRRHGELDEAEVAARLLRQQMDTNTGWWLTQIRRAEHAALLFLASLVPGVGERHIAAREAAANAAEAERLRQVEAEAAEAAAATEIPQGENPVAGSEPAEGGGQENQQDRQNQELQENPPQDTRDTEGHAPTQPVVGVVEA